MDWSATEDELSEVFSKYGTIERVRIPRDLGGKSKGFAFVVFSDKVSLNPLHSFTTLTHTIQDAATASLDLHNTKLKSRLLHVSLSTADPAKRHAINATARASTSTSPAPDTQNTFTSATSLHPQSQPYPSNTTTKPHDPALAASISARTLALLHVPDTVSEARLRALLSPYGGIKKLTLRPEHGGAVVEFEDEGSVGKASLGVEGVEVDGSVVQVRNVRELMRERGVVRKGRIEVGKKAEGKGGEGVGRLPMSGVVRRPGVAVGGGRRGGKGGLGLKGSGGGLSGVRATTAGASTGTTNGGKSAEDPAAPEAMEVDAAGKAHAENEAGAGKEKPKPKSNADFKALFLKEAH